MWLSRIKVSSSYKALRWLGDRYKVHQQLAKAFDQNQEAQKILFYIDEKHQWIIVQSPQKPNWERCFGSFNVLIESPDVCEFSPNIAENTRLKLTLFANCTKQKMIGDQVKRVGVWKEPDVIEWLNRKGQNGGFSVDQCYVTNNGLLNCGKNNQAKHQAVEICSLITVTDSEVFASTLQNGLGKAKFLGFGLPLIARC